MDFENYFYVILAIIYFLSRVLKGKKQAPEDESYDQPETTGKKPVTFEDLLKEFTEDKSVEPEPEVVQESVREVEDSRPKSYRSPYSDEESKSIFEKSIKEAEMLSKGEEPAEKKLVFKEFKPYQEEEETTGFATEIREMLQSGDGGKKAIILAEILNRRY